MRARQLCRTWEERRFSRPCSLASATTSRLADRSYSRGYTASSDEQFLSTRLLEAGWYLAIHRPIYAGPRMLIQIEHRRIRSTQSRRSRDVSSTKLLWKKAGISEDITKGVFASHESTLYPRRRRKLTGTTQVASPSPFHQSARRLIVLSKRAGARGYVASP